MARAAASHYALLFGPGERSHWLMRAPVSACSARVRIAARTTPGGSAFASSRSRVACSTRRSSRGCFWLRRFRYCVERGRLLSIALHPHRVRRERNCLSVTDSYQRRSDDEVKIGILSVEYKCTSDSFDSVRSSCCDVPCPQSAKLIYITKKSYWRLKADDGLLRLS